MRPKPARCADHARVSTALGLGMVARTAGGLLFGLHPNDPLTIAVAIAALAVAAVGAKLVACPARSARAADGRTRYE